MTHLDQSRISMCVRTLQTYVILVERVDADFILPRLTKQDEAHGHQISARMQFQNRAASLRVSAALEEGDSKPRTKAKYTCPNSSYNSADTRQPSNLPDQSCNLQLFQELPDRTRIHRDPII